MSLPPEASIRSQYDFRPDVLDVILSGRSLIDSSAGLHLRNLEQANRFILSYGYDFSNPIEKAEVMGNFHEALNFIRRYFLQPENPSGLRIDIPRKILELTDIAELFRLASQSGGAVGLDPQALLLRNWACSVLKVMHTIAHIDKDLRSPYFLDIQMQILDRFYKIIHRDGEGNLFLGDKDGQPIRINLVSFEAKPKKARNSIILKLLHKPENVAEDIFDRVGIRFITETPLDCLRVVKYIKDQMIIVVPNIKPSRSRNTLVDLEEFRVQLASLQDQLARAEITEKEFVDRLQQAAHAPRVSPDNPHSSEFYHSIQFTCRQLIKLCNPVYDEIRELKALAKSNPAYWEIMKVLDRVDMVHLQREVRFFYPYEVQVLDIKSHEENERGRSAHSEYKKAQLQTALRRVMGGLVDAAR
ncbi:MAG TPA: hypothetical protein DCS07_16370 [Bdellovibrionales bacterium]|nr:MAG: hypothetical protein A2Z97_16600 [Bdellovibrionales bacterium GWB1_52_6]OFZ05082.1 MAG: hypothetical protein A2X97_00630 [Bdellovibrionales bacterium GWA1_52_35]OFZ40575.1 MAG: hypothetical protein A2070_11260 [Bdellovibrionales bacterium GWC1_52_8]HAR44180.1 hypothetical protein [Bdellovibrionales bacterium]HCM41320.1 hypothetical protein [Bdellovibrionales bacterium]